MPVVVRLLVIVPTLGGGGAERVMTTLLRHLSRSKFQVTLIVVDGNNNAFRSELPADVEVISLGSRRIRQALFDIVRQIRYYRPDVILSTNWHLNLALACTRWLMPPRVRLVAREFAVLTELYRDQRAFQRLGWLYRLMQRRFDKIICQSTDMKDDMVRNHGVLASRVRVIHNPVDVRRVGTLANVPLENSHADSARIRFVAIGRLVHQKGFDLLIDAVAGLDQGNWMLEILGEGPLETQLKEQVLRHGLGHCVDFLGFQANPYPYLARADGLLLSSRYEGFPNVVLEALACSTPVIATPAPGGVREILDVIPQCAVADSISAESFRGAIQVWMLGSRQRVPPGAVARYDAAAIVKAYEEVLAEALR